MSRIGKKPVAVPSGVTVKINGREVNVSGPKGTLAWTHPHTAKVSYDDSAKQVFVTRIDDTKESRAKHGLTRALINNMANHLLVRTFDK